MRVIRSAGQNVSPADDGRLYSKAFADGLFEDVAITSLGTNLVSIGSLYGIICGRDFTAEAQNINVVLPETEGTTEGVIYVEIDISSDDVITIDSALKPFTPTYEDINMNGAVAQMVIAEYTATPVAVTDVTSVYPVATAGGIGSMATIELSPVQNSYAVGDFLVWKGQLYKVTAAIASGETLVIGTNIEAVTIGSELTALNNGVSRIRNVATLLTERSVPTSNTKYTLSENVSNFALIAIVCGWGNGNVLDTVVMPSAVWSSNKTDAMRLWINRQPSANLYVDVKSRTATTLYCQSNNTNVSVGVYGILRVN